MANQQQLEQIRQGVGVWNAWRRQHPERDIDLSGADLSKVNLSGVDLSEADTCDAQFSAYLESHQRSFIDRQIKEPLKPEGEM